MHTHADTDDGTSEEFKYVFSFYFRFIYIGETDTQRATLTDLFPFLLGFTFDGSYIVGGSDEGKLSNHHPFLLLLSLQ